MIKQNAQNKQVKNLIIGGGLSGLTLAYFLEKDYMIVEKDDSLGGYCRTIENERYVWDYAGHFYHFRTKEFKELFESFVEDSEIIMQKKNTKIFYKNRLINYPFQMNIHELEKEDFIACLHDLFFKCEKDQYDSFLDMLYGKFGESIVKKFLKPYNEKLYATDLSKLDTDAMGRFFPYADLREIIGNMKKETSNSYNDTFLYLKRGAGYFINKLAASLDSKNIITNAELVSIDTKNKVATMRSGEKIQYENLINTIPLNNFLRLLGSESSLVDRMSYNKVLVFNLGFDCPSKKYKQEHWIYYPEKDKNFYRVGFYNNILNMEELSLYVEIGFSKKDEIDVEGQLEKTLKNLKVVGIIDDEMKLVDKYSLVMDPAYVHIESGTDRKLKTLVSDLERQNIYTLGRYGKWTYSSMEDCMIWAKELSFKIK